MRVENLRVKAVVGELDVHLVVEDDVARVERKKLALIEEAKSLLRGGGHLPVTDLKRAVESAERAVRGCGSAAGVPPFALAPSRLGDLGGPRPITLL
mgnify:CR=1 FL=1